MRSQADGYHPDLKAAMNKLLSSGGKRIRPAVALLTGRMLGADQDRLVTLAAAIELLHTATLVHDDLIDGSLLRRGMATINAQWSPSATVLTGDFIFARAAKLASETASTELMYSFAETLTTIVNGEMVQMLDGQGMSSREDYYQRIYAKTASMFELATSAAATLSPVDDDISQTVRRYGYEIGMAFQIMDDILDFTGEQTLVGKPVAYDLSLGLVTLPTLYFIEDHPDNSDIEAVLNGDGNNQNRMSRLIKAIRQSGAIEKSIEEAEQFIHRGIELLDEFPDGVERQALEDLAFYIINRHK